MPELVPPSVAIAIATITTPSLPNCGESYLHLIGVVLLEAEAIVPALLEAGGAASPEAARDLVDAWPARSPCRRPIWPTSMAAMLHLRSPRSARRREFPPGR